MTMNEYYDRLGWIDDYIKNVAPYLHMRREDRVLIKIPNEVYKLNPSAVMILRTLLAGKSVYTIADSYPNKEEVAKDLHDFFCDLRAVLKGCYRERDQRLAIEKIPFSLAFNTLPVLSEIAITYRCNLSCKFCYAACGCRKDNDSAELSTAELKEVISIIRNEADVPSLSFTGGEPMLRSDLAELIRHAKSLKMWTNLITNATLIDPAAACVLRDAGLDSAQVSLEAASEVRHDAIVQKGGAFYMTMEGLRNLRKAGIRVHTNTTICGLNRNEILSIPALIKEAGLDKFSMNMLMPAGAAIKNFPDVAITYSEIGDIVLSLKELALQLGLEFMWYSPTPVCIFNPVIHGLGNKGCAACDGLLSVSPSGDILPCSSYPKPMANMLRIKGRFRRAWQSRAFRYFRNKGFAHRLCRSCDDLAICNGGCPLYWKQLGYGELLNARKEAGI